ncbi:hypothetical protein BDP27DRAFT_1441595 [Rhodocollybia butyracea]|uniref:Uncharacterized protein n=1 Tax=Rhodocollybia butyracea TaxID=206335 RepID=A0A9P5Q906_9AGAR|nr:hypothetical protein BDP27DRAFT_1441595 [Rhodocollybia butyracea]
MFLCRRLLLHRVYISSPGYTLLSSFRTLSLQNFAPIHRPLHIASKTSYSQQDAGTLDNPTLRNYMEMPVASRLQLSSTALARILKEAVEAEDKPAVGYLANDLLRLPDTLQRDRLIRLLLASGNNLILPNVFRAILSNFLSDGAHENVSDYDMKTLLYQIATRKLSHLDDLSATLFPIIMRRLKSVGRVPVGAKSVSQELPHIVNAAFELLYYLLLLKNEGRVLDLFQVLTEKLYIPPEAVQQAPTTSTDFNYIVSVTLARACLYWYKREMAFRLLLKYLPSDEDLKLAMKEGNHSLSSAEEPVTQSAFIAQFQQNLDPQFLDLCNDILYATIHNPNPTELNLSVDVITRVHLLAPVEGGIIRSIYTAATDCGSGDIAQRLYAFTREPAVETEHRYPGPRGPALLFLLNFLTQQKGNTHLARTLANEIVDNDTFLPVHDRPQFVYLVVNQGFGRAARVLWERYAVGRNRVMLVGNNALLNPMVKFFTRMARRAEEDFEAGNVELLPPDAVGNEENAEPEPLTEDDAARAAQLQAHISDLKNFVARIIESFVEVHQPLSQAQHQSLSSLARAYFVAGEFSKGFEVFKNLIRRREVPDLYDINIGLTILAEHRPRSAAKMIEVMLQRGLDPDPVTFGTVIHHALVHGDVQLVGNLLQLARLAGNLTLTRRGLASLIRASVIMDVGSGKTRSTHLKDALKLLKSMPTKGMLSSPDMGKFMVYACLREKEFFLAFEFWRLLLKYSAEWDDAEQVFIRGILRRNILEQLPSKSEWIAELRTRPMSYSSSTYRK